MERKNKTIKLLSLVLSFFFLFSIPAQAKVLNLNKDWLGFELYGGYQLLSDYDGSRGTITESLVQDPAKISQSMQIGFNFIFTLYNYLRLRTGFMYTTHPLLGWDNTVAGCYNAENSLFQIAYIGGLDFGVYHTKTFRAYVGGLVGLSHVTRASMEYTSVGCAGATQTEKAEARYKFLYGGNIGFEYGIFSRMSIGLEIAYLINNVDGWKAKSEMPAGGLRGTAIESGSSAVLAGQSKKEKLGGLSFRLVIRSYF